jgi:hypothetical protein
VLGEAPDIGDPVVLRHKHAHHHAKQEREQPQNQGEYATSPLALWNLDSD